MTPVVSFDVFSALTDSRTGGSAFLQSLADERGWPVSGTVLYERWDSLNKESHRTVGEWVSFRNLSALALRKALRELQLPAEDATAFSDLLVESMAGWPLWPDVTAQALLELGVAGLGLLSNIDDDLLAPTAVVRLGVFDPELVLTSEKLRSYKPAEVFYARAGERLGQFVHVASSARDVRGAVSAGIPCMRLARPGHSIDESGPRPQWTAESVTELGELIAAASV